MPEPATYFLGLRLRRARPQAPSFFALLVSDAEHEICCYFETVLLLFFGWPHVAAFMFSSPALLSEILLPFWDNFVAFFGLSFRVLVASLSQHFSFVSWTELERNSDLPQQALIKQRVG